MRRDFRRLDRDPFQWRDRRAAGEDEHLAHARRQLRRARLPLIKQLPEGRPSAGVRQPAALRELCELCFDFSRRYDGALFVSHKNRDVKGRSPSSAQATRPVRSSHAQMPKERTSLFVVGSGSLAKSSGARYAGGAVPRVDVCVAVQPVPREMPKSAILGRSRPSRPTAASTFFRLRSQCAWAGRGCAGSPCPLQCRERARAAPQAFR